jgi:hypothetical protein
VSLLLYGEKKRELPRNLSFLEAGGVYWKDDLRV